MDGLAGIYDIYNELQGVTHTFLMAVTLIVISFSIIQCFLGYKVFKYIVTIIGFLTLFVMGAVFGTATDANITLYGFLFGIAGAFIAYKLYLAGIFLMCASAGMMLGVIIFNSILAAGILSILTGVVGVIFTKPFIIASTAISGGFAAGNGIAIIFEEDMSAGLLLGAILALAGGIYQFINVRKHKDNIEGTPYYEHTGDASNPLIHINNGYKGSAFESASKSAVLAAETISAVTKSAAANASVALDVTGNALSKVMHKAKQRINIEAKTVFKNAKGVTYWQISADLKELFYNNKICRMVIPFSEIIACALAAIYVVSVVGSFKAPMPSLALIYLFCALSAINGKLLPSLISLTAAETANLYRFIKSLHNIELSSIFYISTTILEIVVIFFCVHALYYLYSNYQEHPDKSSTNTEPLTSPHTDGYCKDCGFSYSGIDKYCGICGNPLTPPTVICKKCASQNHIFDKYCGTCGEKICS